MSWICALNQRLSQCKTFYIRMNLQAQDSGSSYSRQSASNVREQWESQLDFFLSTLGYIVGLSNFWRFPFLAYSNGGGAFLIPYFILLICVGIPVTFLELVLGQFSSSGPTACWDFCKLFDGVGIFMAIVSALIATYYNVIICWSVFYFFASMSHVLPWHLCGEWSTNKCLDRIRYLSKEECVASSGWPDPKSGLCHPPNNSDAIWIWDDQKSKISPTLPAEEYFERRVTGIGLGYSMSNLGPMRWDLVFCLLFSWIMVIVCLYQGVKSFGKVAYVTATCPYILLTILLFRGLTLEGGLDGIKFYLTPDLSVLLDSKVWKDAAFQILFSLAGGCGGLITLASYNKFHSDILRDSLAISLANCLTSIYAGFVVFSFLGFLTHWKHTEIRKVASANGPTLAFGVYAFSITLIPGPAFWSLNFFIMLLMLGIDSQIVMVETVITSLIDIQPQLRHRKFLVLVTVCFAMCLVGLVMTTSGGLDVLNLFDTYAANWNLLMIVMFECITVSWIYGSKRFMQDINVMLGEKFCRCCTFGSYCRLFWSICWSYVTPAMCLVMMVLSWMGDRRTHYFPIWAQFIGCLFTLSGLAAIVGRAAWNIKHAPGSGFREKLRYTITPTKYWGPALLEHRILITSYVPGFVVYPDIDGVDLELLKKSMAAAAAKENPDKRESGMKTESETEFSTA